MKRYGPETYPYSSVVPAAESNHHTGFESDSALWQPSSGDLAIGYDSESLGAVVSVTMDGAGIDASNYKVDQDSLVLAESYMNGIGFGKHKLKLITEHGSHTASFRVKGSQSISVDKTSVTKTFGESGFSIDAKVSGDGELTYVCAWPTWTRTLFTEQILMRFSIRLLSIKSM